MLPDQGREGDEYNTLRGNKSAVSLDRFEPPGTTLYGHLKKFHGGIYA